MRVAAAKVAGETMNREPPSSKLKNTGAASSRAAGSWPAVSTPLRCPSSPPAGDSIAMSTRWPTSDRSALRASSNATVRIIAGCVR
jgi:hypothetical protein